jgi:hypothetical protein
MSTTVSFVCSKHLVQNAESNFETDSVSNSTSIIKSAVTKDTLRNLLYACLTSIQLRTVKFVICFNISKTQLYFKFKTINKPNCPPNEAQIIRKTLQYYLLIGSKKIISFIQLYIFILQKFCGIMKFCNQI